MRSILFETILNAEIGNGKAYVPVYSAGNVASTYGADKNGNVIRGQGSRTEWKDINDPRVSPSTKSVVKDTLKQLDSKEIAALNDFDPNPVDIKADLDKDVAVVTFPNGKQKKVSI